MSQALRLTIGLLLITVLASACETPAQRKAAENRKIREQAAQEVSRICALPEGEREAALKKLQDESGMVLYCGK